jgi:hypothetical protein
MTCAIDVEPARGIDIGNEHAKRRFGLTTHRGVFATQREREAER